MPRNPLATSREELESFIAAVNVKFGPEEVTIARCKPPAYISCFFQNYHSEIIIAHKRVIDANDTVCNFYEQSINLGDDAASMDVTGNPLEAPFGDVSILKDTSFTYLNGVIVTPLPPGLEMKKVRTLCNIYNFEMPANCLPLWVVCDGSESEDGGVTRLMCTYKSGSYIIQGWATDTGSNQVEPNPKAFLSGKNLSKTSFNIASTRLISQKILSEHSLNLKLSWKDPVFYPPLSSKSLRISLAMDCHPGSDNGPMRFIWEQLLLINNMLKTFENDESGTCASVPIGNFILGQIPESQKSPLSALTDILEEPIRQAKNSAESKTLIDFISEVSSPTYHDLDVLGKLWFLFLRCASPAELKRCLETLQEEIKSKNMRAHLYQLITATSLTQVTDRISPCKHLIEFGVLKFHKEITLTLSKYGLTSRIKSLPRFSGLSLPAWCKTVLSSLQWLSHSFCVLELVSYVQEALNVSNQDIPSLACAFVDKLTDGSSETKDVCQYVGNPMQITIDLQPQLTEKVIAGLPDEWLMEVKSPLAENYIEEDKLFYGTVRPFVLPESDHNGGNLSTHNVSTMSFCQGEDVMLWSAALHMRYHKVQQFIPLKGWKSKGL